MKTTNAPRLPYMPGLDGLRAVAVLAVFFYHAGFLWAMGGFLGVESFFVVSGYLITALLLQEYHLAQGLALKRFWLRRARRLLPALWLLLFGALAMTVALAPDAWARLREDLLGALFYATNWVYIFREIPYFEAFGRPPLLRHLWSLAVEEQFYLLWPLFLFFLLRWRKNRAENRLAIVLPTLGFVVASAGWMAWRYNPAMDPARVYYGTDTRAAGFLMGAVLAMLWPPDSKERKAVVDIAGFLGLGALLLLFVYLDEFTPYLYRGGFLLTDLATALVIMATTHPRSLSSILLGNPFLRWVGTRSYAIYLWHWPLMVVYRYGYECSLSPWGCAGLHLGLSLLLAEISYRLVEQPIRKHGFRAWMVAARARLGTQGVRLAFASIFLLIVGSVMTLESVAPPSGIASPLEERSPTPFVVAALSPMVSPALRVPTATVTPTAVNPLKTAIPSQMPLSLLPTPASTMTPSPLRLTLIGDSVMESTLPLWQTIFPPETYVLDAKRSRTMADLLEIIPALAADGCLASQVVIHIGTNRPFEPETFDQVMETLLGYGVVRVFFVNVHRPVPWEYTVNKRLALGVARWSQAALIDWHALSTSHTNWFVEDKTHLTYTGRQAYVDIILGAVGVKP